MINNTGCIEALYFDERWQLGKYSDVSITCSQCGKKFTFSEEEQDFYRAKGYTPPLRCKQCRSVRQQRSDGCSQCGNKLVEGSPQYCAACYIDVQLQFEQKAQGLRTLLQETEARLKALEAENSRLAEESKSQTVTFAENNAGLLRLLKQKEDEISSLEQRLDCVLAEKRQSSGQKDSPAPIPLLAGLKEKIELLERNQDNMRELLLKYLESDNHNQRGPGFRDSLKSLFRSNHSSPA
jgi:hypothetical protein